MTIDEAKNVIYRYISFSQENMNLLVALKALLKDYDNGYREAYNKAIDDFASELENHSIHADIGKLDEVKMEWVSPVTRIKEVAEQLKAGGENV